MVSAAVSDGRKCFRGPGLQRGWHKRTLPQTRGGWRALGVAAPTALEAVPLARGFQVAAPFLGAQCGLALLRAHSGSQHRARQLMAQHAGSPCCQQRQPSLIPLGVTACAHVQARRHSACTSGVRQHPQQSPGRRPARPGLQAPSRCSAALQRSWTYQLGSQPSCRVPRP